MKQLYFLMSFLISTIAYGQTTDLLISKYGEGSSQNKFLEIYNGTGAAIDLSNYSLSSCSNGCNTPNEFDFPDNITFPTGTMLANNDVYVIADSDADPAILAEADTTFEFLSNGDDMYALTLSGATAATYTIIDILGDMQGDPGSGWLVAGVTNGTQNHTLTRKSSICSPNPIPLESFGTNATDSEWIVGASDSGWSTLGSFTGCSTIPIITLTSPADGTELASGTITVDAIFNTENAPATSQVDITVVINGGTPTTTTNVTSPFAITPLADGDAVNVTVELVDGGVLASDVSVFTVAYPCDLQIGTITTVCDAETSEVDTYTTTLDFTGGGTSTYIIDTGGVGTVSGNDPSTSASGQIVITGVNEATNFTVNFLGDASNSSCDFTRNITSPTCVGAVTCANPGDIIITEIMQNPSAVSDANGEYFEIYNTTTSAINMQGWTLDGGAHTISVLTVPAQGYAVLGINSDSGTNGGVTVDYQYSNVNLSNASDSISIECSGTVIDVVAWDDGATFPDPNGASMELAVEAYNSTDNDIGSNWGAATDTFGAGDMGTPGSVNSHTLSINNTNNTLFSLYPNPTASGIVTISSSNGQAVDVVLYDVLGKQVLNKTAINGTLNVSSLHTGVYIARLSQGNQTVTKKLVIQ